MYILSLSGVISKKTQNVFFFYFNLPANIYKFKVNNRSTTKLCEINSTLIIKTTEGCHQRRSGAFIINFEHFLHLFLVFFFLTRSK